ncbi:MAG: D-alanyl-D-alanine carboxypeptidase family protein [Patescibacteria group bacterium UBA2163]
MISRDTLTALTVVLLIFIGALFTVQTTAVTAYTAEFPATAAAQCTSFASAPEIEARAAYVLDINTNTVLYKKEASQQLPLASLTKLMTVLVALETLDPTSIIAIDPNALDIEGDSGLLAHELWRIQDLIDFTLMTSSNDGAHALALAVEKSKKDPGSFIKTMNQKTSNLGLSQTYFLNDTGLDVSTSTGGSYGSPRDIATLLTYIYKNKTELFSGSVTPASTFVSISGITHTASHTSSSVGTLGGEVIAKTGFTDLAGGNLALVAEPILGRPVAIVVFQSTRTGRDRDITQLYEYAKTVLKRDILCRKFSS